MATTTARRPELRVVPKRVAVPEPPESRRWLVVVFALFGPLMTLMLFTAETGPGELRDPTHAGPARVNPPWLGFHHWPLLWQAIRFGGGGVPPVLYRARSA